MKATAESIDTHNLMRDLGIMIANKTRIYADAYTRSQKGAASESSFVLVTPDAFAHVGAIVDGLINARDGSTALRLGRHALRRLKRCLVRWRRVFVCLGRLIKGRLWRGRVLDELRAARERV